MKYVIDTEFVEGTQKKLFGITKPTIDLISIGIVAEDGREYYAISTDFNLKEAWNRFQLKKSDYHPNGLEPCPMVKVYWLRDNVLKPIFREWYAIHNNIDPTVFDHMFTYKEFKRLLGRYGKTNKQIAEEVKIFIANRGDNKTHKDVLENEYLRDKPIFYGYYSDYDWVVFCWLFGRMIDLPKGFPMYCIDLKQEYDKANYEFLHGEPNSYGDRDNAPKNELKLLNDYPKQINEHNALSDARWNKQLYEFLNTL
jgi:hypothetical protein